MLPEPGAYTLPWVSSSARVHTPVTLSTPRATVLSSVPHRSVVASPGVAVHANVADVRPFLAQSGVLAVPLRIGGGSRLKILEALASGLPVVSTQIGAEGLRLRSGEHLDVVPGEADMPAALLNAMRHPDCARAQCRRGRQVVLDEYGWDGLAQKLEHAWRQCAALTVR